MKRTKQTQKMIDYVNMYLEKNHITDDFDDVFLIFSNALVSADAYNGHVYISKSGRLCAYNADDIDHIKLC